MKKPESVDAYIKSAPKEVRAKLVQMRKSIKSVAPKALEKISYGMPYYGYKGRLAYFAYAKKHIGLYVMPPIIQAHKSELKSYETSKATVRFPLDKPLPVSLIKKLVRAGVKKKRGAKMNKIFKSVGAVLAGFVFIVITHTGTDAILQSTGILPKDNLFVGTGLILAVLGYRALFSVFGCYIAARLAPSSPMKHALSLGLIGVILSAIGAIATANMNLGPAWYAWTLVVISLPVAWLGGKLYELRSHKK